ncbi:hypothetical protein M427DRAFT_137052 [Gonapodya prolifera JEL478]|uniref:Uncharacterized protein n=1 Tax=Gonapodya prolifera (strain JEL478) TaxID=1344416 RepID=A0A139A8F2_GONPJ|nr:hypothetical protein M427DRAFT_137052 [Gonapodya prolifera JEL478]|eukprot:KXS12725.1 hypothetical protein M427DRAFT_137052 [Gonapodya prolifera JEL478]
MTESVSQSASQAQVELPSYSDAVSNVETALSAGDGPPLRPPPEYQKKEYKPANLVIRADGSSLGTRFPRPASTDSRLILDVYGSSDFGKRQALSDIVLEHVPVPIERRRVDAETWKRWMRKFEDIMESESFSIFTGFVVFASVVGIPYWLQKHIRLQKAVAKFQDDFNNEVLQPKGMYFKTATSTFTYRTDYRTTNYHATWITIALNAAEAELLMAEDTRYKYDEAKRMHYSEPKWNHFIDSTICCGVKRVI